MSKDIHKWSDGRYTLMFDEHTFFVWDNEKDERMTALQVTKKLNEQQSTIEAKDKEIAELDQQCADFLGDKIKALEEFEECTDKLKAKILEQQDTIQELERKLKKYAKIGEEQLEQIIELQDELNECRARPTLATDERGFVKVEYR